MRKGVQKTFDWPMTIHDRVLSDQPFVFCFGDNRVGSFSVK